MDTASIHFPRRAQACPAFRSGEDHRAQNFVAQETHTFSPAVIGVARFSFLRNKFLFGERIEPTTPRDLGFGYQPSLEAAIGPPFIQVNGYTTVGDPDHRATQYLRECFRLYGS